MSRLSLPVFQIGRQGIRHFRGRQAVPGGGLSCREHLFSIWLGRWASSPGLLLSRIPQSLVDPLSLALWAFAGHYSGMIWPNSIWTRATGSGPRLDVASSGASAIVAESLKGQESAGSWRFGFKVQPGFSSTTHTGGRLQGCVRCQTLLKRFFSRVLSSTIPFCKSV